MNCAVSEEIINAMNYAKNLANSPAYADCFDMQLLYGRWYLDAQRQLRKHEQRCQECLDAEAVSA